MQTLLVLAALGGVVSETRVFTDPPATLDASFEFTIDGGVVRRTGNWSASPYDPPPMQWVTVRDEIIFVPGEFPDPGQNIHVNVVITKTLDFDPLPPMKMIGGPWEIREDADGFYFLFDGRMEGTLTGTFSQVHVGTHPFSETGPAVYHISDPVFTRIGINPDGSMFLRPGQSLFKFYGIPNTGGLEIPYAAVPEPLCAAVLLLGALSLARLRF